MEPVKKVDAQLVKDDKPKVLSAMEVLECEDLTTEDVFIPEWKGYVKIRMLSTAQVVEFVDNVKKGGSVKDTVEGSGIELIAMSAINEDGTLLFTLEQAKLIAKKRFSAFMRLQKAVVELNGLNEDIFGASAKKD